MNWIGIDEITARVPLPEGYRFELLKRAEIAGLPGIIEAWLPDISIGGASCYLREDFFADQVFFADAPEKDVLVVLIKQGAELAGVFSCERDRDTLALYGRRSNKGLDILNVGNYVGVPIADRR